VLPLKLAWYAERRRGRRDNIAAHLQHSFTLRRTGLGNWHWAAELSILYSQPDKTTKAQQGTTQARSP